MVAVVLGAVAGAACTSEAPGRESAPRTTEAPASQAPAPQAKDSRAPPRPAHTAVGAPSTSARNDARSSEDGSVTRPAADHPIPVADLPPEARATLARIRAGGPFSHRQDGSTFQNREGLLPRQPRGHYREYTVETPGSRDRGARRIVTGGDPPREYFWTRDHYRSFRRIEVAR